MPDMDFDADDQDGAETFDETHMTSDGEEIANFDEIADVYDVTARAGDEDDETALELDAADFDDADLEEDDLLEDDDPNLEIVDRRAAAYDDESGLTTPDSDEIDGLTIVADAELVEGGEDDFSNFESRSVSDEDLKRMGYAMNDQDKTSIDEERSFKGAGHPDDVPDQRNRKKEKELDHGLKETFPASDPVSINPGAD